MFTINSATNPNDRNLNNYYLKHFKNNNKLSQELKKQITPKLISDAIKEAISQSKKTKDKGYKLEFTIDGIKPVEEQ
jgi:hypothetical protein